MRRVQSGQSGEQMVNQLAGALRRRAVQVLRRLDRPHRQGRAAACTSPSGRKGVERNIVVTSWEWRTEKQYLHDLIASDRRNPTVNAYGPLFGSPEYSTDVMPILDPKTHKVTTFKLPVRDPDMPEALGPGHAASVKPLQPSPYWGDEKIWDTRANNHNAMFDKKGRVWLAASRARHGQPGLLQEGLRSPVGEGVPARALDAPGDDARSEDDEVHLRRHLLRHASSAVRLRRRRHAVAQRHRAGGRLDQHQDVRRDRRRGEGAGLVAVRPRHQRQRQARRLCRAQPAGRSGQGQAHRARLRTLCGDAEPGRRLDLVHRRRVRRHAGVPALRSRHTGLSEIYNVPLPAFGIRGGDIDKNGVVWASLRAAISAASTAANARARSTARPRPATTAPRAGRSTSIPARASRASARTAPSRAITRGSTSTTRSGSARTSRCRPPTSMDGLVALKDGKMISLRVPYPLGFYAKGFDGRIDDPNAGWKGRGLWTHQRRPHAVADGRRQGQQAPRRALPAPARPAGAVIGAAI